MTYMIYVSFTPRHKELLLSWRIDINPVGSQHQVVLTVNGYTVPRGTYDTVAAAETRADQLQGVLNSAIEGGIMIDVIIDDL